MQQQWTCRNQNLKHSITYNPSKENYILQTCPSCVYWKITKCQWVKSKNTLNAWKDTTTFMDYKIWDNNFWILSKLIYRFKAISTKLSARNSVDIDTVILNVYGKSQTLEWLKQPRKKNEEKIRKRRIHKVLLCLIAKFTI